MKPPGPIVTGLVTVVWLPSVLVAKYCVVSIVDVARFESEVIVADPLTVEVGIVFFLVCS
jgi:hypothetical protein